jgi:hypothetical protein
VADGDSLADGDAEGDGDSQAPADDGEDDSAEVASGELEAPSD